MKQVWAYAVPRCSPVSLRQGFEGITSVPFHLYAFRGSDNFWSRAPLGPRWRTPSPRARRMQGQRGRRGASACRRAYGRTRRAYVRQLSPFPRIHCPESPEYTAHAAIKKYIEALYNRIRPYSALENLAPAIFAESSGSERSVA